MTNDPDRPDTDPADMPQDPAHDPNAYPADKARQGEVILKSPLQKRLFFGGLIAIAVFVIIMSGIVIGRS